MGDVAPTVAVAGATGFIGRALLPRLRHRYPLVALTRSARANASGVEWRQCDLFSLLDAERALEGAEVAYFLVHSMLPSAHLTQGSFADMDLIVADNFARACRDAGVRQIIYLGGLIPDANHLSRHLASRLEVENALRAYGTPVTALRASMVIGPGGSSFDIMTRLNARLPVMLTPKWTLQRTQPIALDDALALLVAAIDNPDALGRTIDIGGPDVLTYRDLLRITGEEMGKPRRFLSVPFFSPRLSKLWVRLVSGAPKQLVNPLIDSLVHEMVVRDPAAQRKLAEPRTPFREAAHLAIENELQKKSASWRKRSREKDVRSVQRLPLPAGHDARWVAEEYAEWLPRFFSHLIHADVDEHEDVRFRLTGTRKPLLALRYAPERSSEARALFYIEKSHLVRRPKADERPGRLEFRSVLADRYVIAAIHDYRPSIPWRYYGYTQALVHVGVMKAFKRYLGALPATN